MFLKNICSQLVATYGLKEYELLPADVSRNSAFLLRLLHEISTKLEPLEKLVLLVDAMDEVEEDVSLLSANLLLLPSNLPRGIYFILTSRKTDLQLRFECEQKKFVIAQDQAENLRDIEEFIMNKTNLLGIWEYLRSKSINKSDFLESLSGKSQGNFMYLKYVIPEIEKGNYYNLELIDLPDGLLNYYEDHWNRMRRKSDSDWLKHKLPILIALSIAKEPISIDLISEFSQIRDIRRINATLLEWQQFLYQTKVEKAGISQRRWRVYHDSFREFIAKKEEVEGEHVDLTRAHGIIADALWDDLHNPRRPNENRKI